MGHCVLSGRSHKTPHISLRSIVRPTVINPDYNMISTLTLAQTYIWQNEFQHPNKSTSRRKVSGIVRNGIIWPVNTAISICRYPNHLYGIMSYHKHIVGLCLEAWAAVFNRYITMNHIDTGAKAAADARSPLWRTRFLDPGYCSFAHPSVRDNRYSQTTMLVETTLAHRRDVSTDVGPTLAQPTLLSRRFHAQTSRSHIMM